MSLSHDAALHVLGVIRQGGVDLDTQVRMLREVRGISPEEGECLDRFFIGELQNLREGLKGAQTTLGIAREQLKKLSAVPWHPATYLGPMLTPDGPQAMVAHGGARRIVGLTDDVRLEALTVGTEVLLGAEMNVIMAVSPTGMPNWGDVSAFRRRIDAERIVLCRHDEEIVVKTAGPLRDVELAEGDLVRWLPSLWLAYERIERTAARQLFLEEVPDIGRDQVGGQERNLDRLLFALSATLLDQERARKYGLKGRQSVMMVGPPGCGKTLMARVAAAELTRRTGQKCRFGVVKPSAWEDPYVGVTQRNIRECFQMLREAAKDSLCVLLMDEIESVGRIRGGSVNHHSDKFLATLLDELDGFTDRSRVALISASNRKDLIDPALLQRISDIEIPVRPPDMRGSKRIFEIHLGADLPYRTEGGDPESTRQEMIAAVTSRFYAPNAANSLCVIRFRDNTTRTVYARELASGRVFEQVCRVARQAAFRREFETGAEGLCVADIEDAAEEAIEHMKTTLTPLNVHSYLSDLRQDMDVIAVEPVVKRVSRPGRYRNVA